MIWNSLIILSTFIHFDKDYASGFSDDNDVRFFLVRNRQEGELGPNNSLARQKSSVGSLLSSYKNNRTRRYRYNHLVKVSHL